MLEIMFVAFIIMNHLKPTSSEHIYSGTLDQPRSIPTFIEYKKSMEFEDTKGADRNR